MKYIDGTKIEGQSINTAYELAEALHKLSISTTLLPVEVTDEGDNYVTGLRLFEKTLSDGSKELVIQISFDK